MCLKSLRVGVEIGKRERGGGKQVVYFSCWRAIVFWIFAEVMSRNTNEYTLEVIYNQNCVEKRLASTGTGINPQ